MAATGLTAWDLAQTPAQYVGGRDWAKILLSHIAGMYSDEHVGLTMALSGTEASPSARIDYTLFLASCDEL